MKDVARKALLIGLGLGIATKEKAENVARELLKKGEANEDEVRKLAGKLLEESKKQEKKLRSRFEEEAKKAVNLALARSEAEIRKLRARLNALNHKKPKKKAAAKKRRH